VNRSERGGVAIFGLVLVVLAGLVLVGLGRAGAAAARSARAETAADAAALAAADRLARDGDPAAARAEAAAAAVENGGVLERCDCGADHAEVVVVIGDARGRARAEVDRCAAVGAGC
jgi:hypothetical protein